MSRTTTVEVTNKVLSYLRFKRRCIYIATEVGVYNSDILAVGSSSKADRLIEVEVKISVGDFKNDFKKSYTKYGKKYKKHDVYANNNTRSIWVPNYFYFAVPVAIHDSVFTLLDGTRFGLILVDDLALSLYDKLPHCTITKKASILHNREIDNKVITSIVMRMGSELITARKKLAEYSNRKGKLK